MPSQKTRRTALLLLILHHSQKEHQASAHLFHRRKLELRTNKNKKTNASHTSQFWGGHQDEIKHTNNTDNDSPSAQTSVSPETTTTATSPSDNNPRGEHNPNPSKRLFGTRRMTMTSQQQQKMMLSLKKQLERMTSSAKTMMRDTDATKNKERFFSALGPSVMAVWAHRGGSQSAQRILSFGTIYALSLLGSSVGFYSFLYFISVGYALGIMLPMIFCLVAYQRAIIARPILSISTLFHSILVILWGLRALTFFLWREYVNWPALHKQIRTVNESNAPTIPVKCLIWFMYSFLYTAMLSPCWFRLQRSARLSTLTLTRKGWFTPVRWFVALVPLLLQLTGLALESLADYQKSNFKLDNRYEWCNTGLWNWSTHPNYLGELIFWTGTYLGWILFTAMGPSLSSRAWLSWLGQFLFCTVGYIFITTVLRGSIQSMSRKHWQKYGHIPEYAVFRQTHGLLGPKRKYPQEAVAQNQTVANPSSEAQDPKKEMTQSGELKSDSIAQ